MHHKHSLALPDGRQTSISLEDEFWFGLCAIALRQRMSVVNLIYQISCTRQQHQKNLASAVRVFVLKEYRRG